MPYWAPVPQQLESLPPLCPEATHMWTTLAIRRPGGFVACLPVDPDSRHLRPPRGWPRKARLAPGVKCLRMTHSHPNPAGVGRECRRHCLVLEHTGTF